MGQLPSANQLPWKPWGTRCGSGTEATGAADMSYALSTTNLDESVDASWTNVTSQPSSSPAPSDAGTNTGSPVDDAGPKS